MAQYRVTAPDGTKYVVTGPDGASQDEVLAQVKAQHEPSKQPATPSESKPAQKDTGLAENAFGAIYEPLANMATGMVAKPISDVMGLAAKATGKETDNATAEGFKRQVQEDLTYQPRTPAGQAVAQYNPLALLGKGVGWLGSKAGDAISGINPDSEALFRTGRGVEETVNQLPSLAGVKTGEVAPGMARAGAEHLMQSAFKPTLKTLKSGDAARAITTMLDQGIPVSKAGVNYMREQIDALNKQIKDAIKNSPEVVDKTKVADELLTKLDKIKKQVTPQADIATIEKAWEDFMDHPLLKNKNDIPVQLAQDLKTGTYRSLRDKYGQEGSASVEAQKTLARGLKEGIAQKVPEVVEWNKKESELLNALSVTERRILMESNKNPMGLALLAHNPQAWAAFMADRSGAFKSLTARILDKAGVATGKLAPLGGAVVSQNRQMEAPPPQ